MTNPPESWLVKFLRDQLRPFDPTSEPQPRRLHWAWLLILSIALGYFVGALFIDIWLVLQANWIRRASGSTLGLRLALCGLATDLVWLTGTFAGKLPLVRVHTTGFVTQSIISFYGFAMAALYLATIFVIRNELEEEPIGLSVGGVMTFFFSSYYFQYLPQDYVFTRLRSPSRTYVPATSPEP